MYLVFFTLIGECTLMDLGLLDIKLIIRTVIEAVKKYGSSDISSDERKNI